MIPVRGRLTRDTPLAPYTWLRVGGPAERLLMPADREELASMLGAMAGPVTVIGVGSNLLVRDGGIRGLVVRLGRAFGDIAVEGDSVRAGAAALDAQVARAAAAAGLAGLEFLRGIPGAIGGAVAMNAGCYGTEVKDRLTAIEVMHRDGRSETIPREALAPSYRHGGLPEGAIVLSALFRGQPDDPAAIAARMDALVARREASQPVREKTGGSTFRNPAGFSTPDGNAPDLAAWRLIDAAGCRGLRRGGAMVSEQHCNFLINTGEASAADLEGLGEAVRRRVRETSGHDLHWEIRRIGERA